MCRYIRPRLCDSEIRPSRLVFYSSIFLLSCNTWLAKKKAYVLATEPFYELHAIQQSTLLEPKYFMLNLCLRMIAFPLQ
jgi:hypothetical protein